MDINRASSRPGIDLGTAKTNGYSSKYIKEDTIETVTRSSKTEAAEPVSQDVGNEEEETVEAPDLNSVPKSTLFKMEEGTKLDNDLSIAKATKTPPPTPVEPEKCEEEVKVKKTKKAKKAKDNEKDPAEQLGDLIAEAIDNADCQVVETEKKQDESNADVAEEPQVPVENEAASIEPESNNNESNNQAPITNEADSIEPNNKVSIENEAKSIEPDVQANQDLSKNDADSIEANIQDNQAASGNEVNSVENESKVENESQNANPVEEAKPLDDPPPLEEVKPDSEEINLDSNVIKDEIVPDLELESKITEDNANTSMEANETTASNVDEENATKSEDIEPKVNEEDSKVTEEESNESQQTSNEVQETPIEQQEASNEVQETLNEIPNEDQAAIPAEEEAAKMPEDSKEDDKSDDKVVVATTTGQTLIEEKSLGDDSGECVMLEHPVEEVQIDQE